jgi:hypothetical protein
LIQRLLDLVLTLIERRPLRRDVNRAMKFRLPGSISVPAVFDEITKRLKGLPQHVAVRSFALCGTTTMPSSATLVNIRMRKVTGEDEVSWGSRLTDDRKKFSGLRIARWQILAKRQRDR